MFEMVVHSYKVNLYGNDVAVETKWYGRRICIGGQLTHLHGDIPGSPCSLVVTPEGVTIESDGGKKLEIRLSHLWISGVGGEE